MAQPKVILFDLYETLITEFTPGWTQVPFLTQLKLDSAAFMQAWKVLSPRRMTGDIPDFPTALRELYQMIGETPDETAIEAMYRERLALKARPLQQIDPSVIEMLDALQEMPIRLGLLSNAASEETPAWADSALAPYFTDVIFSCEVGLQKPDPRVYQLACERLNISVDEAWFVGDGGSDELRGAAAVGLTPYWASWFLDRWPAEKRSATLREAAAQFPRLKSTSEFVTLINK